MGAPTPGPWERRMAEDGLTIRIEADARTSERSVIGYATRRTLKQIIEGGGDPDPGANFANARLIAAAPDMLAALEALNAGARPSNWDDDEDPGQADAWRQLDAALAKAHGENAL